MIFIVPLFIFLLGDVYSFYIFADSSASSHNALDWNQPSCPSDRVCSWRSRGYRFRCVPTVPRKPFRTVLSSRLPVLVCPQEANLNSRGSTRKVNAGPVTRRSLSQIWIHWQNLLPSLRGRDSMVSISRSDLSAYHYHRSDQRPADYNMYAPFS